MLKTAKQILKIAKVLINIGDINKQAILLRQNQMPYVLKLQISLSCEQREEINFYKKIMHELQESIYNNLYLVSKNAKELQIQNDHLFLKKGSTYSDYNKGKLIIKCGIDVRNSNMMQYDKKLTDKQIKTIKTILINFCKKEGIKIK